MEFQKPSPFPQYLYIFLHSRDIDLCNCHLLLPFVFSFTLLLAQYYQYKDTYLILLIHVTHVQAPNLLITLINMFLGFGSSPKVNVTGDPSLNEYSIFGPSTDAAAGQVSGLDVLCIVLRMTN